MYPRQFLLSDKAFAAEDFLYRTCLGGRILSWQKELNVYITANADALILGDAWQADPGLGTPESELEKLMAEKGHAVRDDDVYRMEESWCGRYVLIVLGRVYLDAGGLLGVFVSGGSISSSCALLAAHLGLEEIIYRPKTECNWLPGLLTPYKSIRRLIPTQVYSLDDHSLTYRELEVLRQIPEETEEALTERFTELFAASLRNMRSRFPDADIYISATGGFDSRAVIAAAKYAGLDFTCFTQNYDAICADEIPVAKNVCSILGVEHIQIDCDKSRYSEARKEEYERHTSGLANDGDKRYYLYDQFAPLVKPGRPALLLRGQVWEIALEYYFVLPLKLDRGSLFAYYDVRSSRSLAARSIEEWLAWEAEHPSRKIPASVRCYQEQRVGNWLSSIEQGFDLLPEVRSFHPVNCRLLLCTLLKFPYEGRINKMHEYRITTRACPELEGVPYANGSPPQTSRLYKYSRKVGHALKRIRWMGLRRTLSDYRTTSRINAEILALQKKI